MFSSMTVIVKDMKDTLSFESFLTHCAKRFEEYSPNGFSHLL